MPGGRKSRNKGKTSVNSEENVLSPSDSEDSTSCADKLTSADNMEDMKVSIIAEIKQIRTDISNEINEATDQLKRELGDFRGEMNTKLNAIETDIKDVTTRVEAAEDRINEMEAFNTDARDVLSHSLELQEQLQTRLEDLEARSRRNNIRIHGIEEEAEGDDITDFVERFIKTELALPDTPLGIQRCHRSLAAKPPHGANPRSIVLCFLEFQIKERVLQSAWKRKDIQYKGKRIFFEQDYTSDILAKRKAYAPIRRALKEKNLRCQTLHPARLHVHLQTGTVIYRDLQEAANDLKGRGVINTETFNQVTKYKDPSGPRMVKSAWQSAGTSRRQRERIKDIQEKLKEFRRNVDATS